MPPKLMQILKGPIMNGRNKIRILIMFFLFCFPGWLPAQSNLLRQASDSAQELRRDTQGRPNIIVIFADDLGYGDLSCYGAEGFETPNLDRIAENGIKFTSFYVAAAGCAPSRAALLTGCYPPRVGGGGGSATSNKGLHPDEITVAEMLKDAGYQTAIIGKWHQGWSYEMLPQQQGFDYYYGLPYSHDMSRTHATNPEKYPPLPMFRGNEVIEIDPDQSLLTTNYTREALEVIDRYKENPFFLYLCFNMPHVPLFVPDQHRGKTDRGLFGDVVREIDLSVGQIMDSLKKNGLEENTLVIFTSDNGPWLSYGDHGGSAGPLREGKGTTFEGGMREPCVMQWPARIPKGQVSDAVVGTIDFMRTFANLSGGTAPTDRIIDGKDITALLEGKETESPHEAFFYYGGQELQAVRSGPWKLHFPHKYRAGTGPWPSHGIPVPYHYPEIGLSLFNLENDIGETTNIIDQHPEVVEHLNTLADTIRTDIGDSRLKIKGKNNRPLWVMSKESFEGRTW
jgi:arylsulfatase A